MIRNEHGTRHYFEYASIPWIRVGTSAVLTFSIYCGGAGISLQYPHDHHMSRSINRLSRQIVKCSMNRLAWYSMQTFPNRGLWVLRDDSGNITRRRIERDTERSYFGHFGDFEGNTVCVIHKRHYIYVIVLNNLRGSILVHRLATLHEGKKVLGANPVWSSIFEREQLERLYTGIRLWLWSNPEGWGM